MGKRKHLSNFNKSPNFDGYMTGSEHFQNGRPCLVFPVHSGKNLSKWLKTEQSVNQLQFGQMFGTEKCGEQRLSHLAQSHTWATLAQIVEIVITIYNRKVSEHKMHHSSLWLWSYSLVREPTLSAYKGHQNWSIDQWKKVALFSFCGQLCVCFQWLPGKRRWY